MKVLLTGAGGQLGRAVQAVFTGHEVAALGHGALDITDLAAVRAAVAALQPALVLNAAAWTDVDGAESDPAGACRVNALGPRNLALACAGAGAVLLHISTDYVFDGRAGRPYHEYDATAPLNVYGAGKLAGEEAVRVHCPRHYIVRTAWLYGAEGRNFPNTLRGLAERPEVRVVDDQHGSPTYAPHLARALLELVETQAWGTWHLAGSGGTSWYGLTCELFRALGVQTPVVPVATAEFPRPAERPKYAVLESIQSPAIRLPPWEEGLAEFVREIDRNSE